MFGIQFEGRGQVDFSESMENIQLSWDGAQGIVEVVIID
jgi:hypothetical protein